MKATEEPQNQDESKTTQFCAIASLRPKRRCRVNPKIRFQIVQKPASDPAIRSQPPRMHRSHAPLQIWKSPELKPQPVPASKSFITPLLHELVARLGHVF